MSRNCPNCAADVLENAKFCIKCGTKMPANATLGAITPSAGVRTPQSPPTPISSRPPVSSANSPSSPNAAAAIFAPPPPAIPSENKKEEVSVAQVESVKAPTVNSEIKTESTKSGSSKGIIFGGIGVLIAAIGGFLLTSGKDEPTKAISAPVVTAPPVQITPPVPPPPPAAAIPPRPPTPTAPAPAATPAPIAQKSVPPSAAVPAPAPAPAPAPSVPDVNKLMRDAANK